MIINYDIKNEGTIIEYLESFYISKSKIYKLFLNDLILLNNHKCKREDKIKKGDVLSLILDEEIDYKPLEKDLDILYEDDYFLIINKPKNIIIHDENNSLCNIVANYYKKNNINLNLRFAHRLDKDTTGLIIFVKCPLCLSYLNHFIETHEIRREYIAIVNGKLNNKKGSIDLPIGEDRHISNKKIVSKTGKKAVTHYEIIEENNKYSMVKILLETGRTHQIRCHFSHIGHPLIGDVLYGDKSKLSNRYLLHSYKISFVHPITNERIEIEAKIPLDFKIGK